MPKIIILNQLFQGRGEFPMAETRLYVVLNNVRLMVIDILKVSLSFYVEVALHIS